MKRHIGKITNTDQRCVVAMMQIPGRESHALVVCTDTLPPRFEQALMEVLESPEGQQDEMLANVMMRRIMPDTGHNVMQTLHEQKFLVPVPVSQIVMLPLPNMAFPLSEILAGQGKSMLDTQVQAVPKPPVNPYLAPTFPASIENNQAIARNMLIDAQLLEDESAKKRNEAYRLAPELNPATKGQFNVASDIKVVNPKVARKPRAKKQAT